MRYHIHYTFRDVNTGLYNTQHLHPCWTLWGARRAIRQTRARRSDFVGAMVTNRAKTRRYFSC